MATMSPFTCDYTNNKRVGNYSVQVEKINNYMFIHALFDINFRSKLIIKWREGLLITC